MLETQVVNGVVRSGGSYLRNTPGLGKHKGTQPDLFLAWNAFAAEVSAVDVVLYFHGFAVSGGTQAALSDFVEVSGLDAAQHRTALAGRTRPTLAIVPRGSASATPPKPGEYWPYRFPALAAGGAVELVAWCLARLAEARRAVDPAAPATLALDRLILMGHSGGGRGILDALPGIDPPPHEIFFFDALYQNAMPSLKPWIASALADDAVHQRRLWIGYLPGTRTHSKDVADHLASALKRAGASAPALAQRFKVEAVRGEHMQVPRTWAPRLLADHPAGPAADQSIEQGRTVMTMPEDRLLMAQAILKFEARRDHNGHLAIYELPEQDGGGTYEVAGINDRYNKETVDVLVELIRQGDHEKAERLAIDFIAQDTDRAASWSRVPAVEFYLRDSLFNRGPSGAARILQRAVDVTADGIVGRDTRAAVEKAEQNVVQLLDALRQARERYEREVVRRDETSIFWKGLVNRWNGALDVARSFAMSATIVAPPAPPPLPSAASLEVGATPGAGVAAAATPPATLPALRVGSSGPRVAAWQAFLRGQGLDPGPIDGSFGEHTRDATGAFQKAQGLTDDGVAGRETLLKAASMGLELFEEPSGDNTSSNFPPRPGFSALLTTTQREALFGHFDFVPEPQPKNPEAIRILGDWKARNIVPVTIPQLRKALGAKAPETMQFHRLATAQLKGLWEAWDQANLLDRVLTFGGSFAPRFIRGSRTVLSNHAFGSAFDINAAFNGLGQRPALVGAKGSVRELVPIANQFGFFWGGHFNNRPDGMHFEIAFLK